MRTFSMTSSHDVIDVGYTLSFPHNIQIVCKTSWTLFIRIHNEKWQKMTLWETRRWRHFRWSDLPKRWFVWELFKKKLVGGHRVKGLKIIMWTRSGTLFWRNFKKGHEEKSRAWKLDTMETIYSAVTQDWVKQTFRKFLCPFFALTISVIFYSPFAWNIGDL